LGFCGSDSGATVESRSAAEFLAAVEVKQDHVMPQFGIACDGSSAAAFRVARMSSGNNYSCFTRRGFRRVRKSGGGSEQAAA